MWVASKHDWAYDWSQAGCSVALTPAGFWWASAPDEAWPDDDAATAELISAFDGPHGDRRQELVFIGTGMDEIRVRDLLDECLLSDDEMELGPQAWSRFADPFPQVELEDSQFDPAELGGAERNGRMLAGSELGDSESDEEVTAR